MDEEADARTIEWLFFDVGNVLFNDDRQAFYAYRELHRMLEAQQPGFTFADLLAERERLALDGARWILHHLAGRWFPEEKTRAAMREIRSHLLPRYDDYNVPHPGMREVLDAVRGKYRLGVIANQPRECRSSLESRGILSLFEVVAISEELDLHKPDVRIYEWALQQAGCPPGSAVMIGDRIDNDVAPAREAGMRTVHLSWPTASARGWQPADNNERLFLESCDRVPLFRSGDGNVAADATAASLAAVVPVIDAIAQKTRRQSR